MCNRYGYNNPLAQALRVFGLTRHLRWDGAEPNAPLDQIRPTDRAPIFRPADELELVMFRWGLIPNTWHGPVKAWTAQLHARQPLTNARAEGRRHVQRNFKGSYATRRCLVPATNFASSGLPTPASSPKGRKLMWKFTVPTQPTFAFAGLWDRAETTDGPIDSFLRC